MFPEEIISLLVLPEEIMALWPYITTIGCIFLIKILFEIEWGSPDNDSEDDDMNLPASVRKIVDDVTAYRTRFKALNKHIRNRIVSEELEQLDMPHVL